MDDIQVLAKLDCHLLELILVEVTANESRLDDILVQKVLQALEHLVHGDGLVGADLVEHFLHDIRNELVRAVLEDNLDVVLQLVQIIGLRQSLVKQVLLEAPPAHETFAVVELAHELRHLLPDEHRHLRQVLFCDLVHEQTKQEKLALVNS